MTHYATQNGAALRRTVVIRNACASSGEESKGQRISLPRASWEPEDVPKPVVGDQRETFPPMGLHWKREAAR